jgi:glycosyltransferase involved in cell wall biosynthesis
MTTRIAVVVSGFPRRSETFAVHELVALADRGMLAGIYATKRGDGGDLQPGCERLMPLVEVLRPADDRQQGSSLARLVTGTGVNAFHAYFAHAPAAVAQQAAAHLAVPFGFSVHAKDARKVDPAVLAARAQRASCVVACNEDVARELRDAGARVHLVPHGVDLDRFRSTPPRLGPGLRLLAVGRLVDKKGFEVLVEALTRTACDITLRIVGDGPARARLEAQIEASGLAARVTLAGAQTHVTLPAEYAAADVVVVPSVVDGSGDRDGLPNVVLEAMASERPVIGTRVGAIGAAVSDGETGLLVDPGSVSDLVDAVQWLSSDRPLRWVLGRRARLEAERRYNVEHCVERFAGLLEAAYA